LAYFPKIPELVRLPVPNFFTASKSVHILSIVNRCALHLFRAVQSVITTTPATNYLSPPILVMLLSTLCASWTTHERWNLDPSWNESWPDFTVGILRTLEIPILQHALSCLTYQPLDRHQINPFQHLQFKDLVTPKYFCL
jgi:hypothetical protein